MINQAQDKLSNPFEKWTASVDARTTKGNDKAESSPTTFSDISVKRYAALILFIWERIFAIKQKASREYFAFTRVVRAAKFTEWERVTHAVNVIQNGHHWDKPEFDNELMRPEVTFPRLLVHAIVSIREYQILKSEEDCPAKPASWQDGFSVQDDREATWKSNLKTKCRIKGQSLVKDNALSEKIKKYAAIIELRH
jgi:hypothetical protein